MSYYNFYTIYYVKGYILHGKIVEIEDGKS